MNMIVSFLLVACLACSVCSIPADKYTDKFDSINIEEVLASDRLLYNYVKCLKGTLTCTPDGQTLKELLPEALETECAKCTETQKTKSHQVIEYLINQRPKYWEELTSIYDKDGKYTAKYKKEKA